MRDDTITRLRRLYAEATPGPWYAIPHPEWSGSPHRIDTRPDVPHANFGELGRMGGRDAALVVDAISTLPALLDVAEAARRYADESEDAEAYALLRHALTRLEEGKR